MKKTKEIEIQRTNISAKQFYTYCKKKYAEKVNDDIENWTSYSDGSKKRRNDMEITAKQYTQALKKYNSIMETLCYEHNTIGTALSEGTANWNLRDMVAECDYVLSTYYEDGHLNGDMRYSDDAYERKLWKAETGKLKRFISHWLPYIEDMVCAEGHCSQYDNEQSEPEEEYTGKHYVGEIVSHKGGDMTHECIVTAVWKVDGKDGISIKPTGNYGFEVDIYEDQL